jgi:methyl-accepting chemotaxis protein
MTKTRTIGQKLYGGAGLLALLTFTLGTIAWWSAGSIQARLEDTGNRTAKRLALALDVQAYLETAFSSQKSMVLATVGGDTAAMTKEDEHLTATLGRVRKDLDDIEPLQSDDAGRKTVAQLRQHLAGYDQFHAEFVGLLKGGQPTEAFQIFEQKGGPIRQQVAALVAQYVTRQQKFFEADLAAAQSAYAWTRATILGVFMLSALVVAAFVYIVRGINRGLLKRAAELGQGATQVSSASAQVASSSQALSQGATEQAASLEETSASMEEMASMTRRNAENSHQAATLMGEVDAQVKGSNGALNDMVTSMSSIRESSAKVSKIIKTIDEIAFQTNILALNAAVEAARAGEAGMGFAVVADEVRSLAQRSAQAARDTASLIEESATKAQQGSTKVEQVVASIAAITDSVGKVKGLVEEVSVASRQQAQGIDQVTQAIAQMEKVTQSTAATAEESAAASEELSAQAEMALASVALLEQMVAGERGQQAVAEISAQPATTQPAGRRRPTIVTASKQHHASVAGRSPEEILPLEDTGTFGQF